MSGSDSADGHVEAARERLAQRQRMATHADRQRSIWGLRAHFGDRAGDEVVFAQVAHRGVIDLHRLGDTFETHDIARLGVGDEMHSPHDRSCARDRVSMRARRGIVENHPQPFLHLVADDMLPTPRLKVRLVPWQADHVGQQSFGEAVFANNCLRKASPVGRQRDGPTFRRDIPLRLQPVHHFPHRRRRVSKPFYKPRLDHRHPIFGQLVDGGEVFLDRRVKLVSHAPRVAPLNPCTARTDTCVVMSVRVDQTGNAIADPTRSATTRARVVGGLMVVAPLLDCVAFALLPEQRPSAARLTLVISGLAVMSGLIVLRFGSRWPLGCYDVLSIAALSVVTLVLVEIGRGPDAPDVSALYGAIFVIAYLFLPLRRAVAQNLFGATLFLIALIVTDSRIGTAISHWLIPGFWFSFVGLIAGMLRRELNRIMDRLARQAHVDELTDLPNRTHFLDHANRILSSNPNDVRRAALLLIDLDRFKEVNDTLGHHVGDLLLTEVGVRLREALRNDDLVARLGGDEFAVLLPSVRDEEEAIAIARKIGDVIAAPFEIESSELRMEASIGIALHGWHGDTVTDLLLSADMAMYSAKTSNTGYVVFDRDRSSQERRPLALLGDLREAIDQRALTLHYQPKVDLATNEVCGVEALLRWNHPTRGNIAPSEFVPVAERTGLIHPLTAFVLAEALAQCRRWMDDGIELPVAVNVSTRNVLDVSFVGNVRTALELARVPAELLELEVTESTIMDDPSRAQRVLEELRMIGVRIAIDDFGTGYSSLAYLRVLPVDHLKIDRSFVMDMISTPSNGVIVRSAVQLAQNLGLSVIAEGVETQEAMEQLAALGCDAAQGYHLSRPVSADDLITWLHGWNERWSDIRPDANVSGDLVA